MGRAQAAWVAEQRYFYRAQMLHPLSALAQALWHYLMYRENEAFWRSPIFLHTAELSGALGVSISAIKKARRELVEGGYLLHQPGVGNRPAGYSLMSNVTQGQVIQKIESRPEGNAAESRGQPAEEYYYEN